jgi:uncharacterized protein (TIGR02265 family)
MESPMLSASAPVEAQPRIPSSVFEGLFQRGLDADARLTQALQAVGYDRRFPEMDYPVQVWKRCVAQARELVYGELNDEEAYRLLGRKLTQGFLDTLVGRVAAVALPMIGPAGVVSRLPRYLAMMGRPDLEVQSVPMGERGRLVTIPDVHNRPEFVAGALEVALERANCKPFLTVEGRSPTGFRLLVRW